MTVRVNFRNDSKLGGWWFSVPYNAVFVSELKFSVASKRRKYDPASHEWFVEHGMLPLVTRLVRRYFRDVEIGYDGRFNVHEPPSWGQTSGHDWGSTSGNGSAGSQAQQVSNEYNVLGLSLNCRWEDVQRAYRKLAMQCHPDRGGSTERMQAVNVAYSTLKKRFGR
jgi:hypothetical protein